MSAAGIPSVGAFNPANFHNFFQQRRSDFQELSQSLQSGDLDGAQQAYNDLSKLGQNGPFRNPQLAQDFSKLGQALQSGDVNSAQQAFATLQQDFQNLRQGFGHHHSGGSTQPAQSSSTPEIVINIGNNGDGAEQVIINVGAPASGASSASSGGASSGASTSGSSAASTGAANTSTATATDTTSAATGSASTTASTTPGTTPAAGSTSGSSSSASAAAEDQLIINLNNSGPEQITLNLSGGHGNEQIIINFGFASNSSSAPQSGVQLNLLA